MAGIQFYPIGTTNAIAYAVKTLKGMNYDVVDHPTPEVTHLILDVPSFRSDGMLRSGKNLEHILVTLPPHMVVVGGNLQHPALESYRKVDFLQDELYLAHNARITAECAIRIAASLLPTILTHSPVLILGWGRIGKCLGQLLRSSGCQVSIIARKPADRAILEALGYHAPEPDSLRDLSPYRLLFNTAPEPIFSKALLDQAPGCAKIDLASRRCLDSEDALWARGLPGLHAPESSGNLIVKTLLRFLKEDT